MVILYYRVMCPQSNKRFKRAASSSLASSMVGGRVRGTGKKRNAFNGTR